MRSSQVLVLNATYEPINVCSTRRAVNLILKEKAEVLEAGQRRLRSCHRTHERPNVIRLNYMVRVPRYEHRKITRRALFARDSYRCQYCGASAKLTIDHVVPRSRGGGSDWGNVVTSCAPCNARKGDRLPHEAQMFPRTPPRPPAPSIFIDVAVPRRPRSWDPYLRLIDRQVA